VQKRRQEKLCESVDSTTGPNNTTSSRITVYYPFHPLAGMELEVVSMPRRRDLPLTAHGPDGLDIKIPQWMTELAAASIGLSEVATLPIEALRSVYELLMTNEQLMQTLDKMDHQKKMFPSNQEEDGGSNDS